MYQRAYEVSFKRAMNAKAIVSRDGHFITVNEEYSKLLEYSELELLKKRFQDITDPDDVIADQDEAERVASGKIESYEMIKSYITKTKRLIKVRLRVDAVRDEDDKFLCFVAQCVPLNHSHSPLSGSEQVIDIKTAKMLIWLHKNAKWILWILTGLAALTGWVIKEYRS